MTVRDIIRQLHKEGKTVKAYDLYVDELFDIEETIASTDRGNPSVKAITDCEIPPQYVEVGDFPEYIYFATKEEYTAKNLTKNVPKSFPRLCIGIDRGASPELNKNWKGHMWHEIPPIELYWVGAEFGQIPELDVEGHFTRLREQADPILDMFDTSSFYYVKDGNGIEWAWTGNPMKDKVPDGLTLFDAKKESGGRL